MGPFGHALTYVKGTNNNIASLTTPGNEVISYTYDTNNNLTRVDYPDLTAKIYHYENTSFPHLLTGISYVDGAGVTTRLSTYGYDTSTGNAILTQHAQTDNGAPQEKTTLSYDSDTQTTLTDAVGTREVMQFQTNLGVKNLVQDQLYDSNGTPVSAPLQQTFDANNNLTCRKDEAGHVTTYSYNATNQKTGLTEGLTGDCINPQATTATRTMSYQYLSPTLDLPTQITSPSVAAGQMKTTTIQYTDASHPNLPTVITQSGFTPTGDSVSRTVSLGYDTASGQVNLVNGPRSPSDPGMNGQDDVTTIEYYDCTIGAECGQLKKLTNALGHITTYNSYDANGRLLQMTNPNGLRTSYTYDPRGRVTTVIQTPAGVPIVCNPGPASATACWQYSYTPWGDIRTVTDPDNVILTYDHDDAHYLRSISDNAGNRIAYHYDLKGNRDGQDIFDPNGTLVRSIMYTSDLRNRLKTIDAAGSVTQLVFDAVGNLVSETDPLQHPSTLHVPDALNRLVQTLDRLDGITDYGYDVNDRLVQVTTPGETGNRATTSYTYDDLGNLLQEISPDRGTTTYSHDAAGNVTGTTDARGIAAVYRYDALNRLTGIDYPGTEEDVNLTYDSGAGCAHGVGRLCQAVDESGTRTFAYDAFGNLQTEAWQEITQGGSYTTAYTYDADDRLLSLTRPGGQDTAWGRDGLGRIESVVTGSTILLSDRQYRADGLVTGGVYGNGLREVDDYDLQGRLTQSVSALVDGDLNGDGRIDAGDLVILMRVVLGLATPTAEQAVRGDLYPPGAPDGTLDLSDYLLLQQRVMEVAP